MLEQLQPFLVSLLIGLVIGIERERSHPVGIKPFGVRTFILLALLGTVAASVQQPLLLMIISAFVFALIIAGYWRSTEARKKNNGIGAITEFSAGVIYCLGYIAYQKPALAGMLGAAVLMVLLGRERLHTFSRQQLTTKEIQAASTILVLGLGILPFLPNVTVDPWHLFNPRLFGILVLLIASIQFGSYVAIRVFGENFGMIFTGFFGGLLSSTAVFATLPKMVHEQSRLCFPAVAASLFAIDGMLVELSIILLLISPSLLYALLPSLLSMFLVGSGIALFILRKNKSKAVIAHINPLDLKSVIRLSLFLSAIIFLVGLAKHLYGVKAMQVVTFLGGLFELHSVTFATATLQAAGNLVLSDAVHALLLAIGASFLTKFVLLWSLARDRFALISSVCMLLMLSAGFLAEFFIRL